MVETSKQVRVDNWGIFFLSRLQVFFNKTDYCDLTLQFEGNVQLKVHRLVMNACTEYFQLLEQTCDVNDDVLLMPSDLQADVILPIVNFMYTGMLEFQMSIFEKLYKTAELMNMTVLLKLLDAQKQPNQVTKTVVSKVPPTYNLQGKKITPRLEKCLPATLPGRKLPVWKRKNAPSPAPVTPTSSFSVEPTRRILSSDPLASFDNSPKPTRFEWPEEDLKNFPLLDTSFDNLSYTSRPLLTQEEELRASTSFDNVKYSPSSNKKPQDYNPSNVDMDDLKNYVKEQKIRCDMAEYDDDDIDNDLDPIYNPENSNKRKSSGVSATPVKKVRFNLSEKENKDTKINISSAGKGDMNHSKIISEVLKKYPHLVKKNKNIRLKILAKNKNTDIHKTQTTSKVKMQMKSKQISSSPAKEGKTNAADEGPWTCEKCLDHGEEVEFVLYYLFRKHMTDIHDEKFDSKMCKYCGHKSSKHNMLMYHQYTKHGIKPPAAYIFPKCNQCPYVALTENLMIKHKLNHTKFDLQCSECKVGFNSDVSLKHHVQITGHTGKAGRTNYDCQYCTKHYQTGANLFSHIRLQHRDEARRDGIVSIDEEDEEDTEEETSLLSEHDNSQTFNPDKVKILSNVSLASQDSPSDPIQNQSNETETLNNVASGLATSLGLVDIVVLDDNQQYILHSNNQQLVAQQSLTNNQEFILPELSESHTFVQNQNINQVMATEHNVITQSMLGSSDIASTDELVMVLTDHDYNDGNNEILTNDNSNIVVLYSHPVEGQSNQFITSQGNLMLNSETGMLELRNGTVQNAANMQSGAVESIEMIQREIDSHTNTDAKNVTQDLQNHEIQIHEENFPKVETVDNQESSEVILVEEEIVEEDDSIEIEDGVAENSDEININSDQSKCNLQDQEEVQVIVQEDEENDMNHKLEVTESEAAQPANQNDEPEPTELTSLQPMETVPFTEPNIETEPSETETIEHFESIVDNEHVIQEDPDTKENETVIEQMTVDEIQTDMEVEVDKPSDENVLEGNTPESMEIDELSTINIIQESGIDNTETDLQTKISTEDSQEVRPFELSTEQENVTPVAQENEEVYEGESVECNQDNPANECLVETNEPNKPEMMNISNDSKIVDSIDITDCTETTVGAAESAQPGDGEEAREESTDGSTVVKLSVIQEESVQGESIIPVESVDEINRDESVDGSNRDESVDEGNRDESVDESNRDESVDENNRDESVDESNRDESVDESNSTMEEANTPTDIASIAQDGVQTDKDDSQKGEENSEDSQDRIKATKISILDDWEDTDSQQSDHGKPINTVNKLINDWDDD